MRFEKGNKGWSKNTRNIAYYDEYVRETQKDDAIIDRLEREEQDMIEAEEFHNAFCAFMSGIIESIEDDIRREEAKT